MSFPGQSQSFVNSHLAPEMTGNLLFRSIDSTHSIVSSVVFVVTAVVHVDVDVVVVDAVIADVVVVDGVVANAFVENTVVVDGVVIDAGVVGVDVVIVLAGTTSVDDAFLVEKLVPGD